MFSNLLLVLSLWSFHYNYVHFTSLIDEAIRMLKMRMISYERREFIYCRVSLMCLWNMTWVLIWKDMIVWGMKTILIHRKYILVQSIRQYGNKLNAILKSGLVWPPREGWMIWHECSYEYFLSILNNKRWRCWKDINTVMRTVFKAVSLDDIYMYEDVAITIGSTIPSGRMELYKIHYWEMS